MLQCLDSAKYQCTNGKQCCVGLRSAPAVLSDKLYECRCYCKTQKALLDSMDGVRKEGADCISCPKLMLYINISRQWCFNSPEMVTTSPDLLLCFFPVWALKG